MNKKIILIILEIVLIIILIISSSVINFRTNEFRRDCRIEYDINGICPCKANVNLISSPFNNDINYSQIKLNN